MLSESSIIGQVLHALVGYVSRPAGIQVVFYLATLVVIGSLMRFVGGSGPSIKSRPAAAAAE